MQAENREVGSRRAAPATRQVSPRARATAPPLAAEALLDGEAEALTRKAVELALAGDVIALRLCLERILSPRRERPVTFTLPALRSAADTAAAMAALLAAVADGHIGLAEASEAAKLVDAFVRASAVTEPAAHDALFPGLDLAGFRR